MKVCPRCAEELPDEARICTQCGKDTTLEPAWKTNPTQPPRAERSVATFQRPSPLPASVDGWMFNKLAVIAIFLTTGPVGGGLFLSGRLESIWRLWPISVAGLLIGLLAMHQIRSSHLHQRGFLLALVAVVLASVHLVAFVLTL